MASYSDRQGAEQSLRWPSIHGNARTKLKDSEAQCAKLPSSPSKRHNSSRGFSTFCYNRNSQLNKHNGL